MWHTVFIWIHAAAGGLAFVAGCVAIGRRILFDVFLWSLIAMQVSLLLAIATEWATAPPGARVLFATLAALGVAVIAVGARARRSRPAASERISASYVWHVGFCVIALFDAFWVVLVLDLGAPAWGVATIGVGIAVGGHLVVRALSTEITRSEPVPIR